MGKTNNLSLYGAKTAENENVISAEIPTKIDSDIWKDPEKYIDRIWSEIKLMKMADKDQRYLKFKYFNIKKTLSVPLVDFEDTFKNLKNLSENKYEGKVMFPGIGVITRNNFIKWLKKYLN